MVVKVWNKTHNQVIALHDKVQHVIMNGEKYEVECNFMGEIMRIKYLRADNDIKIWFDNGKELL